MQQMPCQADDAYQIDDDHPADGKHFLHFDVEVAGTIACFFQARKTAHHPEMLQMDDEKEQMSVPSRSCFGYTSGCWRWRCSPGTCRAGLAVGYGQHVCLHDVEQNAHEQADLHGADDDVGAREVGCP